MHLEVSLQLCKDMKMHLKVSLQVYKDTKK